MKRGGFSLVEMIIVMALSSFILGMALSTLTTMTTELKRIEGVTVASDEAKRLGDHFATELIGLGGGQIRPWSAIGLEDAWSGTGSDRLTFAVAEDLSLQCPIDHVAGGNIFVAEDSGSCCLDGAMVDTKVLLTSLAPETSPYRVLRHVDSVNTSTCKAAVVAAGAPSLENPPPDEADWVGGIISTVRVRRLWLDSTTDYLMIDEDRDGDLVWESRIAADRVVDFQVALGYDTPKWDWQIDSTGDTGDEWLYNHSADTFGVNDGQGLATARASDLRMIRVGFIVGFPNPTTMLPSTVALLNGPSHSRPGWLLRAHTGTTGLRSYDIMR